MTGKRRMRTRVRSALDYLTMPIEEYLHCEVQRVRRRTGMRRAAVAHRPARCARRGRARRRATRRRATRAGPGDDADSGGDEPGPRLARAAR